MSKYHNVRTVVNGIAFDSAHEAERYVVLRALERQGVISNLRLQVPFELIPKLQLNGRTVRATKYIADFVYLRGGEEVVEDAKGVRTAVYQLKKKLMLWQHGIDIKEV